MPLTITTNVNSLNAQRNLNTSQSALSTSIQRLSSGLRVNSAKDDAAGLAIAERMTAQIKGLNVAARNANDAISLAQVGEGALGKVGESLQRMRELSVQSKNATNSVTDRAALDTEYQQLGSEISRVLGGTKFNGLAIVGADAGALAFQVGSGNSAEDTITLTTTNLTADATITAVTGGAVATLAGATLAVTSIDAALTTINTQRATFGAAQNRFDAVISNLQVSVEHQSAARGRIMDADFAAETASLTRNQILQQAGTAMLAQANSAPNSVLALLRG